MRQIEMNQDALAVCASVLTGVSRGWFRTEDYAAIWETLPQETRDYMTEMLAATRIADEMGINGLEENSHS